MSSSSLGDIAFENSGSEAAQAPFLDGLAALHSFWYEEAADLFRRAQERDPGFALAYWGEALAQTRFLWNQEDPETARAILRRLAPSAEARAAKTGSERERDFLEIAEVLYGPGDRTARYLAFADATERLAERYPDDVDAAAFHALTLQLIARRGPWQAQQRIRSAALLEEWVDRRPDHPGVLHYLLHAYDEPTLAPLGLRAARRYAEVAPAAPHALHMPSHIFVQLGRWAAAASSNEDAWAASVAWVERKRLDPGERDFHSLSWLAYAYLQQGRYRDTEEVLRTLSTAAASGATGAHAGSGHEAGPLVSYQEMLARYLIETRRWDAALFGGRIVDFDLASTHATMILAVGLAAAELGELDRAREAAALLGRLRQREEERKNQTLAARVAIMEREVLGLVELRGGQTERAVGMLREAAEIESRMAPPSGPPHPAKPAHELLGEVLLGLGRGQEAAWHFENALLRTPGRALALLGAGRAAVAMGDGRGAARYFSSLAEAWATADAEVPGLEEARALR